MVKNSALKTKLTLLIGKGNWMPLLAETKNLFENLEPEHRQGGRGSASAPADETCSSPHVIRATDHNIPITDTQSISIDWMRWSGPIERFDHVFDLIRQIFGIKENEFTDKKGIYFYENMLIHPSGLSVIYTRDTTGRNNTSMVVEMSGSVIQHFGLKKSLRFNHYLYCSGFKFTRCDVCYDTIKKNQTIIRDIVESCDAGYLCKLRSYQPMSTVSSGGFTAHGVNVGSRDSSVYYRFYDKGLEQDKGLKSSQREWAVGYWVRMEIEIKQERAVEFGLIIARHELPTDDAIVEACKNALIGHVDFRVGKKSQSIKDRKRMDFWSDYIESTKFVESIKIVRTKTNADSHLKWMKSAVVPCLLSIERKLQIPLNQIIGIMSRGCQPYFDISARPLIWDYYQKYIAGEFEFIDGVDDVSQSIAYHQLLDECLNVSSGHDLEEIHTDDNFDYLKYDITNLDFNSYD